MSVVVVRWECGNPAGISKDCGKGGRLSAIRQTLPDNQPSGTLIDLRELQEISLTFQKIEIVSVTGGTSHR